MKKVLCGVLVLVMILAMAGCSTRLSGTYKTEEKTILFVSYYQTYTFDGDEVTVKTFVGGSKVLEFNGTYEIDGDEITITYAEDEDTGDALAAGTYAFSKSGKTITIGETEMTKE